MRQRNLITIGLIVVALIAIGIIVYFTFLGPASPHLSVSTNPFNENSGFATSTNYALPGNVVAGNAGKVVAPNLVEISTAPVSPGEVAIDIPPTATSTNTSGTGSSTVTTMTPGSNGDVQVNYIDRQSGNVYAYRAVARSLTQLSDKTLPGIQSASWLPDGSMAFVQFLTDNSDGSEDLQTYALPSNGVSGYFLQDSLDEARVVGSTTVFTLAASTDNSVGTVLNAENTNSYQLFTSPLSSIIVYPAGNAFVAVTRAASELAGYAFAINSKSGNFTPILGPLRGLTVLPSPDGSSLLYSYTDGSALHMGVLNLASGTVVALPLATLTDKCVWTSDSSALYCAVPTDFSGNLPDDWFQGAVSFTDRIWRIDMSARVATLVLDPVLTGGVAIDAVNLTIDPNSQVLVFRNKKDSSLWAYTLAQQ